MDPSLVKDLESLEAYLEELPEGERRQVERRVSSRAAMRVLPIAVEGLLSSRWAEIQNVKPIAVFGANALAMAAANWPSIEISVDVVNTTGAQALLCSIAAGKVAADGIPGAQAVCAAAEASACAVFLDSHHDQFTRSVSLAADAAIIDLWPFVRADLLDPDIGIWPDDRPDAIERKWQNVKGAMHNHSASWEVWILWYERVIDGRNWHPDAMSKVFEAFTTIEDWQIDPVAINRKFEDILALYRAEDEQAVIDATPIGETVAYDAERNLLVLRPMDQIAPDDISIIIQQIAAARRIFEGNDGLSNAYLPLTEELALLEDAETRYAKRPILVMKTVTRVLRRLAHKAKTGDCPTPKQDTNIQDFQDSLQDVQLELVALNDEVRAWYEKTRPDVIKEALPLIIDGARSVAPAGNDDLTGALEEVADTLEDDTQDDEAKSQAIQRGAGLLVRSYRAVKPYLDEAADATKKTRIVAGGAGAIGTAVAWFASPAFREMIAAFLKGVV